MRWIGRTGISHLLWMNPSTFQSLLPFSPGKTYGSYDTPAVTGSGGGGTYGGAGGGYVTLNVSGSCHVDGQILCSGGDATSGHCGGGSGGSMYVEAMNFSGGGLLSVEGGDGLNYGFGGSGGRIAVQAQWLNEYNGEYVAYGEKFLNFS